MYMIQPSIISYLMYSEPIKFLGFPLSRLRQPKKKTFRTVPIHNDEIVVNGAWLISGQSAPKKLPVVGSRVRARDVVVIRKQSTEIEIFRRTPLYVYIHTTQSEGSSQKRCSGMDMLL